MGSADSVMNSRDSCAVKKWLLVLKNQGFEPRPSSLLVWAKFGFSRKSCPQIIVNYFCDLIEVVTDLHFINWTATSSLKSIRLICVSKSICKRSKPKLLTSRTNQSFSVRLMKTHSRWWTLKASRETYELASYKSLCKSVIYGNLKVAPAFDFW